MNYGLINSLIDCEFNKAMVQIIPTALSDKVEIFICKEKAKKKKSGTWNRRRNLKIDRGK